MATRKTTKKIPARRDVATESKTTTPSRTENIKRFNWKSLIIPFAIIALAVLIWTFKNQFIVATVNGQPITRLELISQLEKKDGKAVLDSLITESLISQEATKRKISVSQTDVKNEISKIEKSITAQGQNLELVLSQQNMTREDLNKQIKLQLLLKKMVGAVKVSDKEVTDYITQNKASFPETTNEATLKTQIRSQIEQQKIGEKIQEFISKLQSKAKVERLLSL